MLWTCSLLDDTWTHIVPRELLRSTMWDHLMPTLGLTIKIRVVATPQMLRFTAAAGNAFTIFLAGCAFTITTLPNKVFSPAFVAGFVRVLKRHSPGTVNTPVFLTSLDPTLTKESSSVQHTFCLRLN